MHSLALTEPLHQPPIILDASQIPDAEARLQCLRVETHLYPKLCFEIRRQRRFLDPVAVNLSQAPVNPPLQLRRQIVVMLSAIFLFAEPDDDIDHG